MSEELVKHEAQAPIGGNPAHVRLGVNQVALVADYLAQSGLFKLKPRGQAERPMTQQEVFAIVMAGQSLGIGPMPSMMSFHLIEGKPEMSANLQAYFIKSSGKYDYRAKHIRKDGKVIACQVDIIDTRSGEIIGESYFGEDEAKAAGLAGGQNYQKYAPNMYFARCITNAIAFHCPDAVPFRIYGEGEIGGQGVSAGNDGVQALAGEGPVSTVKVERIVEEALKVTPEPEEVIQDADVDIVEPPVNDPDPEAPRSDQSADENAAVAEALDRFSPAAVEARLRVDLPKLEQEDREIVKQILHAHDLPLQYPAITGLIVKAGYTDVHTWLRAAQASLSGAAAPVPEESPPVGVTGRQTGSQTAAVLSDRQLGMFNAKCSEAGLSETERKAFIRKFAQVESSKHIAKADFDDLLAALRDIAQGGPETKAAYLGD